MYQHHLLTATDTTFRVSAVKIDCTNTTYWLPRTQHPVFLLSRYNVPTPLPSKTFLITTDTTSGVSAVKIQCTNTTYCLPQCFCCQDTMYHHHLLPATVFLLSRYNVPTSLPLPDFPSYHQGMKKWRTINFLNQLSSCLCIGVVSFFFSL